MDGWTQRNAVGRREQTVITQSFCCHPPSFFPLPPEVLSAVPVSSTPRAVDRVAGTLGTESQLLPPTHYAAPAASPLAGPLRASAFAVLFIWKVPPTDLQPRSPSSLDLCSNVTLSNATFPNHPEKRGGPPSRPPALPTPGPAVFLHHIHHHLAVYMFISLLLVFLT